MDEQVLFVERRADGSQRARVWLAPGFQGHQQVIVDSADIDEALRDCVKHLVSQLDEARTALAAARADARREALGEASARVDDFGRRAALTPTGRAAVREAADDIRTLMSQEPKP
jgi:hypothetical protein